MNVNRSSLTLPRFSLAASVALLLSGSFSAPAYAQVNTSAHPAVRITNKIDNTITTPLPGTHPAVVDSATIGERLEPSTPLNRLQLVLSPTQDQETALSLLLSQQQDKTSANYHQWLTPQAFGQIFGTASGDVAQISAWLQDQGFAINSVSASGRIITFSGNVGQVESSFHTHMNHVTVNGESHISNVTDTQIPTALAGVVTGIASLNDFFPKAGAVNPHKATLFPDSLAGTYIGNVDPLYTSTVSGSHYVTPGDAAIIYNSTPLLTSGIDGTGQTIAVIGQTDISLADVQQFRSMFGLKKNDPIFTVIGEDPGVTADDIEAYLDVEWAGGMAPGATVNFIEAGSDYVTTSGISASALYAVDNNIGDIITMSYGGCEASDGSATATFWNTLWEQAAAQGQSVFVSAGDAGATGCYQNDQYGTAYGVNALGSSDYNVAVGGTMFVDYGPSQYWTTGTASTLPAPAGYTFTTATGYIPEAPWNEGYFTTTLLNTASTATMTEADAIGGGGGISVFTARPAWQTGSNIPAADPTNCSLEKSSSCAATGVSGQTTGVHRLVPDISSIAAAYHDVTIICYEGSCSDNSTGYSIGAVGGTSVAAPVSASVQALINQKNGGRQGNPNFHYYPLANVDYVSGACKSLNGTLSNPTVTLPAATCNFHDIVTGSNIEKQNSADTTGLGFFAATGYDLASGLGSMNINNVATNWSTVSLASTTTTFTLTPTSTTHGTAQTFSTTVSSTSGTPTGDVELIAVTTTPATAQRYTLASGAYSGSINGLPGGTYNVYVHYAGDGTYAPSNSAPQSVTISKESSTVTPQVYDFYNGHYQTPAQNLGSIPYSYIDDIIATPAGTSATGIPTGTITFALTNTTTAATLASLTANLDSAGTAALVAGGTYSGLLLAANYPALPVGSYSVTVSYSGDSSFNASTGTSTFTITKVTPTGALTLSSSYISSGASETLVYTLARSANLANITSLAAYPSGTVTFTDTTSSTVLGTATLNSVGVATLTTTGITNPGANTITATYSSDNNYNALTTATSATVTVGTYTATTTTPAFTAGTYYVGSSVPLTATVSPYPTSATAVRFYAGTLYLGSANTSTSTGIASYTATVLPAGTYNITASFIGTSTYASSTGSTSITVLQNITTTTVETNTVATLGQTVAIDARITRSPTSSTVPTIGLTGIITFYDGTTSIGTATPVFEPGGSAYYLGTLSISTLTRGTHSISAVYSADPNYANSTSGVIKLTILPDNVWVANSTGSVSGISSSGTAVANPTGGGTGIAIDNVGDIWSLNHSTNSVAEFSNTGTALGSYSVGAINSPTALTIDGAGYVWIANGNNSISVLNSSGAAVSSTAYTSAISTPTSITVDSSGNLWITNTGDNSVTQVIGVATPVTTPTVNAIANNTLAAKP